MKFITSIIITALLSFAVCLYGPWWCIAIVSFIVAVSIPQKPLMAFLSGFLSLFLLWFFLTAYISYSNENLLAHKISIIILKTDSPFLLIVVTALIGAFTSAIASLTGSFTRKKNQSGV